MTRKHFGNSSRGVPQCGYNTDLVHYFSLGDFSGFAHGGEVKYLPQRVPSATEAFLLQPCKAVIAAKHSPSIGYFLGKTPYTEALFANLEVGVRL